MYTCRINWFFCRITKCLVSVCLFLLFCCGVGLQGISLALIISETNEILKCLATLWGCPTPSQRGRSKSSLCLLTKVATALSFRHVWNERKLSRIFTWPFFGFLQVSVLLSPTSFECLRTCLYLWGYRTQWGGSSNLPFRLSFTTMARSLFR